MKINEIVNTSIMKQGWKKQDHRDGLDLQAMANEEGLSILAYDAGGREIGFVHFEIIDDKLESFDTWVDPRMRRQGIATVMYNYAKELGNDLAPSTAQTPDGKKFWKSIKQQATENFADGKNPQDKGDSKRHGIPKHATLAQLDKIAHKGGRRGQLAHWQANMRRGRK